MSRKTDAIYVTFEPDVKRALSECAKLEERTLQAQIRKFVIEGLERLDNKSKNLCVSQEQSSAVPAYTPQPERVRERPAPIAPEYAVRSPLRIAREQAERVEDDIS